MLFQHRGYFIRLRALRVAKEIPTNLISSVTANDLSLTSKDLFNKNLALNNLESDSRIKYVLGDANKVMITQEYPNKFDIIDLDPYGSAVPFLYSSLNGINDKGLLCITCTDTRVLCGSDRHKCYYLYGSVRTGNNTIEETALRIMLYTISRTAAQLGRIIKPLLSFQSEFYIRIFLQVVDNRKGCWTIMNSHGIELVQEDGLTEYHRFGQNVKDKNTPSVQRLPSISQDTPLSYFIRWSSLA